jgi:hypothetical protein
VSVAASKSFGYGHHPVGGMPIALQPMEASMRKREKYTDQPCF